MDLTTLLAEARVLSKQGCLVGKPDDLTSLPGTPDGKRPIPGLYVFIVMVSALLAY